MLSSINLRLILYIKSFIVMTLFKLHDVFATEMFFFKNIYIWVTSGGSFLNTGRKQNLGLS